MHCKYSILIYRKSISRNTVEEIYDYINKGIKVYFITSVSRKEFNDYIGNSEIEKINDLMKNYILQIINDVGFDEGVEELNINDGSISSEQIKLLKPTTFNIEQYQAEHAELESNIILKAGAGTGKTKVMIDRVLYIKHIYEDIKFKDIIMITFTNEATLSMKKKLSDRIEAYFNHTKDIKYLNWLDESSQINIQTIHAFSKKILSSISYEIGLGRDIKLRGYKYDKKKILENLAHNYNVKYNANYKLIKENSIRIYELIEQIINVKDQIDNRGLLLENIDFGNDETEFGHILISLLMELDEMLEEIKIEENSIEINDLIKKLIKFREIDKLKSLMSFKYIMVDEFQDTDSTQVEFIGWFIKKLECSSFVVGDTKQSIYRFRGANHTAFIQLKDLLEKNSLNFRELNLKKNYRSEEKLLIEINDFFKLIKNNDSSDILKEFSFTHQDVLIPIKKDTISKGIKIEHYGNFDAELDLKIINYIKNIKLTSSEDSVAILVRSNSQLEELNKMLYRSGLIYKIDVDGDFYQHIAVKEFYGIILALLYPKESMYQYIYSNSSYGEVIDETEILSKFSIENEFMNEFLQDKISNNNIRDFREKLIDRSTLFDTIQAIIDLTEPHIAYGDGRVKKDFSPNKEYRRNMHIREYLLNLNHLLYILHSTFTDYDSSIFDIEKFLRNKILTDKEEDKKDITKDERKYDVVCMTVHKSKGLEFDHVIIPYTKHSFIRKYGDTQLTFEKCDGNIYKIGYNISFKNRTFTNDYFNEYSHDEELHNIAEETRLFYVALTRAKKSLLLCKNKIGASTSKINNWRNLIERGIENV